MCTFMVGTVTQYGVGAANAQTGDQNKRVLNFNCVSLLPSGGDKVRMLAVSGMQGAPLPFCGPMIDKRLPMTAGPRESSVIILQQRPS